MRSETGEQTRRETEKHESANGANSVKPTTDGIKGAGRNFLDWNTCSDRCLLVSLSGPGIREIEIDDQPGIEPSVTFGAGVQNGELYSRAAESGLAVVSGTCAPVGFAGLALGGGLGILYAQARTCAGQHSQHDGGAAGWQRSAGRRPGGG